VVATELGVDTLEGGVTVGLGLLDTVGEGGLAMCFFFRHWFLNASSLKRLSLELQAALSIPAKPDKAIENLHRRKNQANK
jgi:hypothetical protein